VRFGNADDGGSSGCVDECLCDEGVAVLVDHADTAEGAASTVAAKGLSWSKYRLRDELRDKGERRDQDETRGSKKKIRVQSSTRLPLHRSL
jgi:hypothetical protein